MEELDKAMQETELAFSEMEKRRDEFNKAHQARMKELDKVVKNIESSSSIASYNFNKNHEEIMSDLDEMSKDLDSLLGDTKPSKHNDALLSQLHDENEYLDWLWEAEHPTDYNDCP